MSDTTIFGCGFLGNQRQFTSSEKRLATVNLKKFGDEKGDSTPALVPEKGQRCDKHKDQENKSSIRMITLRPSEDLDILRYDTVMRYRTPDLIRPMYICMYVATHVRVDM